MPKKKEFWNRLCCSVLVGTLLCTPLTALAYETSKEEVSITVADSESEESSDQPGMGTATDDIQDQPGEGTEELPVDMEEETVAVSSISVPDSLTMSVGKTRTIAPTITPPDATDQQVTFQSSSPSVVSVNKNGVLTAKKIGKATITVQSSSNTQVTAKIAVTVRLAKPQDVYAYSSDAGNAYLHVRWSKVDGAKTYRVYRKIKGGDWKRIATVSSTSYTDKDTSGGKTHYYRVAAVPSDSTYKSAVSDSYKIKIPVKPYGVKISSITDQGIEVYWKKPDSINGFEVYRAYSKNGTYTRIVRINDETQGTYIDS
ncbi:MAG: Ig-like domain-containing protein, partial [Butyricicoccaceae bacterium]